MAKKFKITSPIDNYCGVGAGGVQFAYGTAEINKGWVCDWYKDKGYKVEEIIEAEVDKKEEKKEDVKEDKKAEEKEKKKGK